MAPYAPPSIAVAGSLRSLTLQGSGGGAEVGSVEFPEIRPDPGTTT